MYGYYAHVWSPLDGTFKLAFEKVAYVLFVLTSEIVTPSISVGQGSE